MSRSKRTPKPSATRPKPQIDPGQILTGEILDLVQLIDRLKEKSYQEEDILRVVRATLGVGISDVRLAGLLKVLSQFEEQADLAGAFQKAVLEIFGDLPYFKKSGESGLEEDDPLRLPVPPSGRQLQQIASIQDPDGDHSAPADPEPPGERPAGQPAAGRKTGPGKTSHE